jgi:hypothetical protein
MASSWGLEVLTPETGRFLIGDDPAVTIRTEGGATTYGMAFRDAHTLVPPIGPRHLLALGPENVMGSVPRSLVDRLNMVQVHAAERYVYMHPKSGLQEAAALAAGQRADQ